VTAALGLLVASDAPIWVTAGATIALVVVGSVAILGLADARKTRHGQVISELSRRWDDALVLESLTLGREYGPKGTLELVHALWGPGVTTRVEGDLVDWYKVSVYPNLLETLGVYLSEGVISEGIVYKLWGASIIEAWAAWRETTAALREVTETPETFKYFQELAERMAEHLSWERDEAPRTWEDDCLDPDY
jgi:hypothetical protein